MERPSTKPQNNGDRYSVITIQLIGYRAIIGFTGLILSHDTNSELHFDLRVTTNYDLQS